MTSRTAAPPCPPARRAWSLPTMLGAGAIVMAVVGGATVAAAAGSTHPAIKACANNKTGELRLAKACHHNEKRVTWAARGPRGARGARGARGVKGAPGPITGIAPSGLTQRGAFALVSSSEPGSTVESSISFPLTLSAAPTVAEVVLGATSDPHCTGTIAAPTAASGYLCLYIRQTFNDSNGSGQGPLDVEDPNLINGAATYGATLSYSVTSTGESDAIGAWAVTAS
jgi:hypothetical protein